MLESASNQGPGRGLKARRERVDAWFVRIGWVVAAILLALMLHQAFTMRPVEQPAIVRTVG